MNMNMQNPYKDLIKIIDFVLQEMEINPSANKYKIDSDLVPITSMLDGYRDLVQYVANFKKKKLVGHVDIVDIPSKTIDGEPITRYEIYVIDPNKEALIKERQRLIDFDKEEPAKQLPNCQLMKEGHWLQPMLFLRCLTITKYTFFQKTAISQYGVITLAQIGFMQWPCHLMEITLRQERAIISISFPGIATNQCGSTYACPKQEKTKRLRLEEWQFLKMVNILSEDVQIP